MIAWLMEGLALAAMIVVGVLTAASRGDKANH